MPKMTHPDSKAELNVTADRVAMYESQGWQVKAAPKTPDEKSDDKK